MDLSNVKIICTICARGESKGVKNKNIREVGGIPLIAHTIQQAREAGIFEFIAVDSDSSEILSVAKDFGADLAIMRPAHLATDQAAKLPVIKHCLEEAEKAVGRQFDILVDLDATSPLRIPADIVGVVEMLLKKDASNIITGCPSRRSPYFNLVEEGEDGYARLSKKLATGVVRRQDAPRSFDMNASIYAWKREALLKANSVFDDRTMLFAMPEERSHDIDSEFDFEIVKFLMEKKIGKA